MTDLTKEIQDFLRVPVPTDVIDGNFKVIETIDNKKVTEILPERCPQLYVDKAMLLNSTGKNIVLATVSVTKEMCRGHFEWFPMMPLAILGQATAQAGAILVSSISEAASDKIPLVVHVRDIKSISSKKKATQKDFIVPNDKMLVVATYIGGKFGFHKVTAIDYVDTIMMGAMEEIAYVLVDREYFKSGEMI